MATALAGRGSSFYHMLSLAGLNDIAADKGLPPWPTHRIEQLTMDPEIIVTSEGSAAAIKQLPGLASLRLALSNFPGALTVLALNYCSMSNLFTARSTKPQISLYSAAAKHADLFL